MVAKLILRYIKHFPFEVENFWVPLGDGIRLAGRRWQPKDRATYPLPTIFQLVLESSESERNFSLDKLDSANLVWVIY